MTIAGSESDVQELRRYGMRSQTPQTLTVIVMTARSENRLVWETVDNQSQKERSGIDINARSHLLSVAGQAVTHEICKFKFEYNEHENLYDTNIALTPLRKAWISN